VSKALRAMMMEGAMARGPPAAGWKSEGWQRWWRPQMLGRRFRV
jgi:hypothetical protein